MRTVTHLSISLAFAVALAAAATLLPACGPDCSQAPAHFKDVKAFSKSCTECHASDAADRQGAPSSINFDRYEDAKKNPEKSADEIESGGMPPSDGEPISEAEANDAVLWLRCGTPE